MKKVKVGCFGAGRGITFMRNVYLIPEAQLTAICDKYEPSLQKAEKEAEAAGMKVDLFTDFDEFLEKGDMDAVILANYATQHAVYAVKCLKAGKHVISECLPCETMAQAVELIEAVEETGKIYAYAENYCYMQSTFEMWYRYKNGDIGDVMYGEGEYIHDCSGIWPNITYGERDHWRNRMPANFYCTHSIGPLLMMTNARPVQVVGFETIPPKNMLELGSYRGTGIEMITLENGAVLKSVHGDLKREPSSINYELYGQKGMMESGRIFPDNMALNVYIEGNEHRCEGDWWKYNPEKRIAKEQADKVDSHNGSDFYATYFFIQQVLGNHDYDEWSIDVYKAVEMGICGLLAYRSVLDGNKPYKIPNLRNKEERDAWRNDNYCTSPEVAGEGQLLPRSSFGEPDIPDSTYEFVRDAWINKKKV